MFKQLRRKGQSMVILLIAGILLFSGCASSDNNNNVLYGSGANNESTTTDNETEINGLTEIDVDKVYEYTPVTEAAMSEIYDIAANGEWLYVYGYSQQVSSDGSGEIKRDVRIVGIRLGDSEAFTAYSYAETESLQGVISYSSGYRVSVEEMMVTPEGGLVIITQGSEFDPEAKSMAWFDQSGNRLWSIALETADSVSEPVMMEDKLYIACGKKILAYDRGGNLLQQIPVDSFPKGIEEEKLCSEIESLYITENGSAYVVFFSKDYSRRYVIRINLQNGEMTEWMETDGAWTADMISGTGSGYDFIFKKEQGLFGWTFGSEEQTELVNFLDSGLMGDEIEQLISLSDNTYLMVYQDTEGKKEICSLSKVDPERVRERQIILLGVLSNGNNYAEKVIRFNRENDEYMIKVVDYTAYSDPLTQLNLDITTGCSPDIFYADASKNMPFDDYARIGALEDMKPWLDNDEELNAEDFLSNVFEAMSIDGQWYRMPTAIRIYAYLGSSSVFGGNPDWSLEEYYELEQQDPDRTVLWGAREDIMRDVLVFRWDQFVNESEGSCSFDSEEFVRLLEWIKTFPIEEELSSLDVNQVRNGKVLAIRTQFRDFSSFNANLDRLYQHQAEFINLPEAEGLGGMFVASGVSLAMSSQSACKEGAWEFMRYFFTDEYQMDELSAVSDLLPIKLSALEVLGVKAMDPPLGILDSYYLNGREVTVQPPTKETVDEWMDFLKSVTYADTLNDEIYNIITEEIGAFFSGQKSAEDVAKTIQGRVWIYLAERK